MLVALEWTDVFCKLTPGVLQSVLHSKCHVPSPQIIEYKAAYRAWRPSMNPGFHSCVASWLALVSRLTVLAKNRRWPPPGSTRTCRLGNLRRLNDRTETVIWTSTFPLIAFE